MTESAEAPGVGPGFRPRRRNDVASIELDGETIIYDEEAEGMHVLNATATAVWTLADGGASVGEIAGDLAEAFGADPEMVAGQVLALVEDLHAKGLLEDPALG